MAEELGERTEAPTGRRLQEARQRGQVARSSDLVAALDLAAGAILLVVLGGLGITLLAKVLRQTLEASAPGVEPATLDVKAFMVWLTLHMMVIIVPVLLVLFVVAVAIQISQVGFHISTEPLSPKFDRLNPIAGLKRIFSVRGIMKLLAQIGKLTVVILIAWPILAAGWREVISLPRLELNSTLVEGGSLLLQLILWLLPMLLVLGIADFMYQRWQHLKDLRMTRQEVERERRDMDGNPELKSRRLQMARKIALQRINTNVPQADVIVTNPTHYAVAIKYDQANMRAPRVIAKGVDELAWRIRELAVLHAIPVVERPPLARALYAAVEPGQEIHPEHYEAVAEVLAFVYRLNGRAA